MSGFQPWQVQAFMVSPGQSVPWLGQTGRSRIPAPPPAPWWRAEGRDSCSASTQESGEGRAELLSVHKDFSYVSIRPQWAHIGTKYSPINVTT